MRIIPLRLLHTQTGVLCIRDAQISRFDRDSQRKELLSLPPGTHFGQDLEDTSINDLPRPDGVAELHSRAQVQFLVGVERR